MLNFLRLFLLSFTLFVFSNVFSQEFGQQFFLKVKNEYNVELSYSKSTRAKDYPLKDFVKLYKVNSLAKIFKTEDDNLAHTYLLQLNQDLDEEQTNFREILEQYSFIEYIEAVPQYELFLTPNDPSYSQQWSLNTIQAFNAWDLSQGSSNVVIAIVDDAVLLNHQDLNSSIFSNPNEIVNGLDDDGNGYIDDINGWDAADFDNDPNPPSWNVSASNFTHGTHVAGIAAATSNNSIGIASIGFSCKILPVKIKLDNTQGPGLQASIFGVDYAISCGYTDVVNMSFGGASYSSTFQNLINAGHNQGIVFVAAAGNSNTNVPMYPASYNHVISVAATSLGDSKASFSNYGLSVDVSAPGVNIYSSIATGIANYASFQGTSMASPLVAGLCGLMLSFVPNSSPEQIELCLKNSCDDISIQNPSYLNQLGAGRINAFSSLQCLSPLPHADFSSDYQELCPGQTIQFQDLSVGNPTSWAWQFPGGNPSSSNLQNPMVTYPNPGIYNVSLSATNGMGNDAKVNNAYIHVAIPNATLSGNASINLGSTSFLRFDFTGSAPYSLSFSDGINTTNLSGINSNPYYHAVSPTQTTNYLLTAMSSAFCAGSIAGLASIDVGQANTACTILYQKLIDDQGNMDNLNLIQCLNGDYLLAGYTNQN